jgi:hypothetical protein
LHIHRPFFAKDLTTKIAILGVTAVTLFNPDSFSVVSQEWRLSLEPLPTECDLYAVGQVPWESFGYCGREFAFYSWATRGRLDASKSLS